MMQHLITAGRPSRAAVDRSGSRRWYSSVVALLATGMLVPSASNSAESAAASSEDRMPVVTFAIPLAADKVNAARELLAELKRSHLAGLAARAHAVGYHKEVMVLQTGVSGNFLAVHLETNDATAQAEFRKRLRAYPETPFTRWWSPAFGALGPRPELAQELFTWHDSARAKQDRGQRQASITVRKLTHERAQGLRTLIDELKAGHFAGLVERARAVGYYKESMHLQSVADGQLLIIYLEHVGGDLRKRIAAYPETEFTRWWNPKFRGLLDGSVRVSADQAELLLDWED